MSWFSRVVWSEGLFLQPQHFQQQDRHAAWWVESRVAPLVGNHWGFSHLVIDEAALVAGKFAILEARGILPDGTPFDIPNVDLPPPALDFPRDAKDQIVCLALPLRRAQGLEVSLDSADATARLARYEPVDFEVSDAHTEKGGAFSIQVGQPKLRLALSDPLTDAYARVGVARVTERRADNSLLLDRGYIPPVLDSAVSPVLDGYIKEVSALLHQRGDALASRLAHPGAGGVAEVADFLFLMTVNRYQPVFDQFRSDHPLHPRHLFERLLEVAGELATLATSGRRPGDFPVYCHDELDLCFLPLIRAIRLGLTTLLDQNAIAIDLQDHKQGRYVGHIIDRSLLRNAGFILAVNAQLPGEMLRTRFPAQAKLGPLERMRDLVNLQLPGIGLRPLPVAPRQLPFYAGYTYFELDSKSEYFQHLHQSAGVAMHVAGDFPGLQMQFWAIRR